MPADLVVFDALPHAFWVNAKLPESRRAYQIMARFFVRRLANSAIEGR